jgi:hypothetical protein
MEMLTQQGGAMGRGVILIVTGILVSIAFSFFWVWNAGSLSESIGWVWWGVALVGGLVIVSVALILGARSVTAGHASFLGSGKRAKAIQTTGIPATATVLSIGNVKSGRQIQVNDQPYLRLVMRIDGAQAAPYEATVDSIFPHYLLARFQPGATFAVRVDPEDPQSVVIAADDDSTAVPATVSDSREPATIVAKGWSQTDLIKLEHDGKQGIARVVSAGATGRFEGANPVEQIDYEIMLPGEEPYHVSKEVGLPAAVIPRIESTIGRSYPVTVHPEDPQKIRVAFTF